MAHDHVASPKFQQSIFPFPHAKLIRWVKMEIYYIGDLQGMFKELKARHDNAKIPVEGVTINNCCEWKDLLLQIFPNIAVKLDLFHAVQRFVNTLPVAIVTS